MKNQNHYFTLIISLSVMIGFNGIGFAQDSLLKKYQHEIGFGLQFTTSMPTRNVDYAGSTEYQLPGYNLFYRFLLSKRKDVLTAFSGGFFYRRGDGSYSNYVRGQPGQYINGGFEFIDATVGISRLKKHGKRKNFNLGGGVNAGALIYYKGTAGLLVVNFSLNFEMSQAIKLTQRNYLIIGIKQFLETNDFIGSRPNLTSNLFLAYNLR